MFDHLDDAHPFQPDAVFREATVHRGRRLRRRRRMTVGAATLGCSLAVGVGALSWSAGTRLTEVERVEVAGTMDSEAAVAGEPTEATVFLVAGVDTPRPDGESDLGEEVAGVRADTLMLLRADPETGRLSVLSIPRDLMIEGSSPARRINSAFVDGPDALVATIEAVTSVDVDHYVEIDLEGFVELVDATGGMEFQIDAPLRDDGTGLDLAAAECRRLTGTEALALVRSRRVEVQMDGLWRVDPTSDLGRIARQQVLVDAAVTALVDLEANGQDLATLVGLMTEYATVDAELSDGDLIEWGRWLISRGDNNLIHYPAPIEDFMTPEGVRFLVPSAEAWEQAMDDFDSGGPPSIGDDADATLAPDTIGVATLIRPCTP